MEDRVDLPGGAERAYKLGVACQEAQMLAEAERHYHDALQLEPRHAKAHNNLGAILQRRGSRDEAARHYRAALEAEPALANAWFNLGTLHIGDQQRSAAIEHFTHAISLDPGQARWHVALGAALLGACRPRDALASIEAALRLEPSMASAHEDLAACQLNMGEQDLAVAGFRRAIELDPALRKAHSGLLFALNCSSAWEPEDIFREHLAWARRFAAGMAAPAHGNAPDPERRLKVAYVSPDFRDHAVAYFIEPVLTWHDRSRFEVTCYSDVENEDAVSLRLARLAGGWTRTTALDDRQFAERVCADRIDILVDLTGHSAGGPRMLLFARKPAPVQATWLGYLNTTGLEAMDYRITDRHACPAGMERWHTEQLVRMPHSQWCFAPARDAPQIVAPPLRSEGAVTFGSFHQLAKLTPRVIALWGRLLEKLPGSRLLMVAPGMEQAAERIAGSFRSRGVKPDRIEFRDRVSIDEYLSLHNRIDINLDAFPYTGGTSTCHSLWMGVPVVTLAGQSVISRGGASVLHAVGLPELITDSEEEYLETAIRLAADPERLARLRSDLRPRVAQSPLMAAEPFTRSLENAYRAMWQNWCGARG